MSKIIIGIDPGMSGGIAILINYELSALHKMPTFKVDVVKNKKKGVENYIDVDGLHNIFAPYFVDTEPDMYIEKLTHLFGFPASSNFKLGYAVGAVHAVLQSYGSFYMIHQKKWQQIWDMDQDVEHEIDKKTGKIKMAKRGKTWTPKINTKITSLNCAKRLYPGEDFLHDGGRKPHDGCIDALLIATYGDQQ